MKIFISHASANRPIAERFATLLGSVDNSVDVFCSSQEGAIKIGSDFVNTILKELAESDLFIPIISKEYYNSHFAMIELGIACAYLFGNQKQSEEYISPFVLFPVRRSYALSGTPISNLQAGELNNPSHLRNFLNELVDEGKIHLGARVNEKINSFVYEIDKIQLKQHDLLQDSHPGVFFDDSVFYQDKSDIVQCSISNDSVTVNFNMNPYESENAKLPNFVSLALRYIDLLDLGRYLDFCELSSLDFVLTSFTNSLKKITVEFKCTDNNKILDSFEFAIHYGENRISVPLLPMKSDALGHISEVCFVVHPEDVVEAEGMFRIGELFVNFEK